MTISIAGPGFLLLPGLVMMICGLVLLPLRGAARTGVVIAGPLAVLALVWWLPEGPSQPVPWLGYQLVPFNSDALARLFASAFAAVALAGGLFALRQERRAEIPVAYLYAGGAISVAFAADFLTLFVFWEAMAVLAAVIVWMGGPKARGAGQRYIVVHLLGGVLLMAGIAGYVAATGSIAIGPMALDSPAAWLILAGFLVNTATWPISAWLPDAYPAASWSGTVFLSAFTTKAAVLVLIRTFAGADILVVAGLVTIAYASLYAARESNIRRLVAYALVAQLGFMLTATGVGSDLAINGAAAHAVAGIVYQALLFMGASAVFYITGKEDCGDLGGLYRAMPVTTVCTLVGALSIAAFPLTSGYVAKVMISDSVAASGGAIAWFVVTAGSAAAVLHAGWRLPWSVFFGRDAELEASDPPASMRWAMVLLAVVSVVIGLFPMAFYGLLPTPAGEIPTAPATSPPRFSFWSSPGSASWCCGAGCHPCTPRRWMSTGSGGGWGRASTGCSTAARRERVRRSSIAATKAPSRSSVQSIATTARKVFSRGRGRPEAWRSGRSSCWVRIWSSTTCDDFARASRVAHQCASRATFCRRLGRTVLHLNGIQATPAIVLFLLPPLANQTMFFSRIAKERLLSCFCVERYI